MTIPDQMTAAVLHAPGDLRIEKMPVPRPGPQEVLVRVGACGVCGSDVPRVLVKGAHRMPLVPGHEFAGTIAEVGSAVRGRTEDQRVAVFPLIPCRQCEPCGKELYELCEDYDYLGSRSNGGFAEYVVVPAWNLVQVPQSVSIEHAAMTEPAAVALHALRRFGIQQGQSVAIFGAGPIGILVAQWAAALGAGDMWIVDILGAKLEAAGALTVAQCVNATDSDPVAQVLDATAGRGVDLVVEAAGSPITARQALQVAAKGGKVVWLGNPSADVVIPQGEVSQILRKQLTIGGTWNSSFRGGSGDDWAEALSAMADGRLNVGQLITHRYRLEQANAAFAMMKGNLEFYNKVMFTFA